MKDMDKRRILFEVALGNIPPDIIIKNGVAFNVFTREFIEEQSILIKDGMIAFIGPDQGFKEGDSTEIIDAEGMVILPGLIEGHTHILNKVGLEELIRYVIPTGVTTIVTETQDYGVVCGKKSIEHIAKTFEEQPIRIYYTLPTFCGLTSSIEANAFSPEELQIFLGDPKCLGIGEVYWGNLFFGDNRVKRLREVISMALKLGKRVEGHSAGAQGRKLQAYTSLGISSCHEPITENEVIERLRLGYLVMIREGSVRRELEEVKGIFSKKIDFRRLSLTTDGIDPDMVIENNFLNGGVKKALKLGIPPGIVYQMVTINVAEHFYLDNLIGSLSPGKMADLLIIPSPDEFSPKLIMCGGRIIFRDGKNLVEPKSVSFPDFMLNSVKVGNFEITPFPRSGKIRVVELVTRLVTKESIVDIENPEDSRDIVMAIAMDRIGNGGLFMGLLKGFGLRRGAIGTTISWDTTDMIIVGCDVSSIRTAIERLKEIRGGYVYAIGEEIISEFSAPLCGFQSLRPARTIKEEVKKLEDLLKANGVDWEKPLLTLDTLGTPAIPHLRISHDGYVRLRDGQILPLKA